MKKKITFRNSSIGGESMPPLIFGQLEKFSPEYTTPFGLAFCGDSVEFMKNIPDGSVNLVVTSPPFALTRPKKYGNKDQNGYVSWFVDEFAEELKRILTDDGSLVVDIGGSYKEGLPVRSTYHFRLATALEDCGFHLAQEFYWYNPARMPAPAQWVTIERKRVKDSVDPVYWFSKDPNPKADNRKILSPYSEHMRRLIARKTYNKGPRPSEHVVGEKWAEDKGGAIADNLLFMPQFDFVPPEDEPTNLLVISNTVSNDAYSRRCREVNIRKHPARFPAELPAFFIQFLTNPGDVVFDPFGGSCTTGQAAEELGRYWFTCEIDPDYVKASRLRFFEPDQVDWSRKDGPCRPDTKQE